MKKLIIKRNFLIILCMVLLLASCGMSPEQISSALEQVQSEYEVGEYSKAHEDIGQLEKRYKKMTEDQKTEFDTLQPLIDYALDNIDAINEDFKTVDNYISQELYYEAESELTNLSEKYELPPAEQTLYDEKIVVVNDGIKKWTVTSAFNNIESALNDKDIDTAQTLLAELNADDLTGDMLTTYQDLKNRADELKKSIIDYSKYIGKWEADKENVILNIISADNGKVKFRFQCYEFAVTVSDAVIDGKKVYGKYYEVWDDGVDWFNYVIQGTITLELMDSSISLNWSGSENGREFSNHNFTFITPKDKAAEVAQSNKKTITLTGTLIEEKWSHSSGEADVNGDMTAYILKLESPADFEVNGKTYSNVTELQVMNETISEKYINKKVKVTGSVNENAGTFYYRRKLIFFMDSIA